MFWTDNQWVGQILEELQSLPPQPVEAYHVYTTGSHQMNPLTGQHAPWSMGVAPLTRRRVWNNQEYVEAHPTRQNPASNDDTLQKILLATESKLAMERLLAAVHTGANFRPESPNRNLKSQSDFVTANQYNPHTVPPSIQYRTSGARLHHHHHKTGTRLQAIAGRLSNQVHNAPDDGRAVGAARGEYAAMLYLLTATTKEFTLKYGVAQAGGQNGVDQIWAERDAQGNVLGYLVVECKGTFGANLGSTQTGIQLSCRWLLNCLMMMARGDGRYVDTTETERLQRLAVKMLGVAFDFDDRGDQRPYLKVMSIKSFYGTTFDNNVLEIANYGDYTRLYDLPAAFNRVLEAREVGMFPQQQTMGAMPPPLDI